MTQTISSLTGFVNKIRNVVPAADEVLLYRGHSKRAFRLLPSVLRSPRYVSAEHSMLHELVASHPADFAGDSTTLEQLARAQHYSLPTRLLDATWNPLVALYFAATEHKGAPGEVIVFRIKKQAVKFYDSDTVSCLSNLAYLSRDEKLALPLGAAIEEFNQDPSALQLLHCVRVEKPYFQPTMEPADLSRVVAVKPKQNNQRILVQSGAFLLFGMSGELDSEPADGIQFERIIVNGNHKQTIISELDAVAINERSLFPEIERAALYIRRKA